jgi:glycogen debranching enzyme
MSAGVDPRRAWRLALDGLRVLRTDYGFAASDSGGLYHAMFGRDSLWIVLFLLEVADTAAGRPVRDWIRESCALALTSLADAQGEEITDETEEQPGRIIHEVQLEPTAHAVASGLAYDARGRSFAGFDQTFLFVTAVARFAAAFPDDPGLGVLRRAAGRALSWIETVADEDGDGLFEYTRRGRRNLVNQVWKDSFDVVTHVGFDLPPAPLAWIDVQGYAHRALLDAATLFEGRADRLRARAEELREATSAAFWLPSEGFVAVALDGRKRPVRMVSSNAGHALWGGVLSDEVAAAVVARLGQPDLTTEYGVRTLARSSSWYAPFAYHRGNIWPFDNGVLAAGLMRCGEVEAATRVMAAVTGALLTIGAPVELYIALDTDSALTPGTPPGRLLMTRHPDRQRVVQGFSAAALLYFAATLAERDGVDVHR